ncbi:hypothetical protein BS50DRAFT_669283 [Corynespora cassiicola Philippines]|uniref:Uncharacterized protein n=1 Tax=Corynespora cassiicola Philippines TaxID=1448308 RepID=A0A2T2NLX5_CORCC|nr:hypothetical protein BS50DRAFT_669283 [Corynespora cassiicola Philippines]
MRSFNLIAAVLPALAVAFDGHLCNGAGGCSMLAEGAASNHPFRCPDGSRQNTMQTQIVSGRNITVGYYEVVSREEFPATCLNGAVPGDADTLALAVSVDGLKNYWFSSGECTDLKVEAVDCYGYYKNPHRYDLCQVVDTNGELCVANPSAGDCERYGDYGRPECVGWTPEQDGQ